jgi:hypothetical protein
MANSLKELVELRLAATGQNPYQAAVANGLDKNFIDDILRGRKKSVRGAGIAQLAKAIDVSPGEIVSAMSGGEVAPANVRLPPRGSLPHNVEVRGTAYGSIVQSNFDGFAFEGDTIEYVARPPALIGATDIYAIYVVNDSMAPEHRSGGLRFVSSRRPVSVGDTVIVQTRNYDDDPGQAYIKHLKRRTAEKLILEQLNPSATLEIPQRFVISIHKVLDYNDLFGV